MRRDDSLDLIRGLAILSMTLEHLAPGFVVTRLLHLFAALDGASGFVLMSGLVLGLIQPSRIRRFGVRKAQGILIRRSLKLYGIQVILVFAVVGIGWSSLRAVWMPTPSSWHDDRLLQLRDLVLLQVNPENFDILPLYIIFLGGTALVLPLFKRWPLVPASMSVVIYVTSQLNPSITGFLEYPGQTAYFNWGAWQLLFFSGLAVGWNWRARDIGSWLKSAAVIRCAAAIFIILEVAALVIKYGNREFVAPYMWLSDKSNLGLLRFMLAWVAFALLYAGLSRLYELNLGDTALFGFVTRIGQSSLNCFVTISVMVILSSLVGIDSSRPLEQAIVSGLCIAVIISATGYRQVLSSWSTKALLPLASFESSHGRVVSNWLSRTSG